MKNKLSLVKEYRFPNNPRIDQWVKTHLLGFLIKNPLQKDHNEISHILDFLKSEQSPKRITRLGYKDAKIAAEKWVEKLNKNVNEYEVDEKDIKTIKRYNNGYRWVELLSEQSYKREGSKMGHCVATYWSRPEKIYSLRDEKNQPHCTVEITKKNKKGGIPKPTIDQIRGKQNKIPVLKYIPYIREMFLKRVENVWLEDEYEIAPYEMKNLYFYKNGHENLDLCNLPEKITFHDPINQWDMEMIGQAIANCKNVIFKENVELPIEIFSKRKNWIFKKTAIIFNSTTDQDWIVDLSGIKYIQIKNKSEYDWELDMEIKHKAKKKTVFLKNVKAKLLQVTGDNFEFTNNAKIDVLELDVSSLKRNNVELTTKIMNKLNPNMLIS